MHFEWNSKSRINWFTKWKYYQNLHSTFARFSNRHLVGSIECWNWIVHVATRCRGRGSLAILVSLAHWTHTLALETRSQEKFQRFWYSPRRYDFHGSFQANFSSKLSFSEIIFTRFLFKPIWNSEQFLSNSTITNNGWSSTHVNQIETILLN